MDNILKKLSRIEQKYQLVFCTLIIVHLVQYYNITGTIRVTSTLVILIAGLIVSKFTPSNNSSSLELEINISDSQDINASDSQEVNPSAARKITFVLDEWKLWIIIGAIIVARMLISS